jgi:heat shock protein HslJ
MKLIRYTLVIAVALALFQCKSAKPAPPAPSTATLLNTYWRLSEVNGNPLQTPAGTREVHIILQHDDQENRVKGFAGCNNVGGGFTIDGQKLTFSAFTTKMMCPPEQMMIEDFLLKALSATDSYEIKGETLTLLEGNVVLAVFQSVYLK